MDKKISELDAASNPTGSEKVEVLQVGENKSITLTRLNAFYDHDELDNVELASDGITNGHIDDQAQEIAGAKNFADGIGANKTVADALVDIKSSGVGGSGGIRLENTGDTDTNTWIYESPAGNSRIIMYNEGTLKNSFNADGSNYINGGNFGLNISNPLKLLDVNGEARVIDVLTYTGAEAGSFTDSYLTIDGSDEVQKVTQLKQTSEASSTTPSPTGDARENEYYLTALAAGATFAAPSGTPANGNTLLIRIEDNGTTRTLGWNAIYEAVGVTLPTATTAGKKMYVGCIYNSTDSKWDVVSLVEEA